MKKLIEKDYDAIMEYTKVNPYVNLFIVGDLMKDGFNDEIQSFYGRYNDKGKLENVMLEYRDLSLHLYADNFLEEDFATLKEIVVDKKIKSMNFGEHTERKVKNWLDKKNWEFELCNLSVYTPKSSKVVDYKETNIEVIKATELDAQEIINLTKEIFEDSTETEEYFKDSIKRNSRLTYVIKENNDIVTIASAVAFTDDAAMIVGVGTKESARQKGYASLCVQKLCDTLYANGQKAVLFYSNPAAGSIYHKIGFVDQEKYWMCQNVLNK